MTYCFIQAIERGNGATYGSILTSMRATIRSTSNEMSGGPVTSLITMLLAGSSLGGGFTQVFALITLKHAVYDTPSLFSSWAALYQSLSSNKHTVMGKDGVYALEMIGRIQCPNSFYCRGCLHPNSVVSRGLSSNIRFKYFHGTYFLYLFLGGVRKEIFKSPLISLL